MLVDLSNPVRSDIERQAILARLERVPEETCRGTRVLLYQYYPDAGEPIRLLYDVISPGKTSEYSTWFHSKKEVENLRQPFLSEWSAQSKRAIVPEQRSQSLVIEGLSRLSRSPAFKGDDGSARKKILLVGDMLEHSAKYCSVYPPRRRPAGLRLAPLVERCKQLLRDHPSRFKGGTEIEIQLVRRGRARDGTELQTAELKELYERWFRAGGAGNIIWYDVE